MNIITSPQKTLPWRLPIFMAGAPQPIGINTCICCSISPVACATIRNHQITSTSAAFVIILPSPHVSVSAVITMIWSKQPLEHGHGCLNISATAGDASNDIYTVEMTVSLLLFDLTWTELNSSVCVIMYFYFLLTPWVYVGISTIFLVLVQKKTWIFCTSEVLTNYQTPRLGIQPRSTHEILSFPNLYQLWFSPKTREDMTKHKKVVWGGGISH